MDYIGKYITKDGGVTDIMSEQVLGVVFVGTEKELLFLPFSDVECSHKRYHSLQEVIEIAEDFNRQYNNKHIRCSVPTLAEGIPSSAIWERRMSLGRAHRIFATVHRSGENRGLSDV